MTRLSVVMAVHNGERYLREAINSVLAQSVTSFEFLIIDDASTDATADILAAQAQGDARVRVLRNDSNLGPYPSLNRALTIACGSVIARQDADDLSPPDRFAIQLAAFDSQTDVSLVTGEIDMFDEEDPAANLRISPPAWQPRLEWELMFSNVIGAGGHVMFPRLLHGEPVLYATKRRYAEDYGLWCRLAGLGRVVCPAQVVYRYRRHGSSITGRRKTEQDECVAAIGRQYRSSYLPTETHPDVAEELSRFWTTDGGRPLAVRMRAIHAHLAGIRSNFLADIERRYGMPERTRLEAELNEATGDRLGYWLYRSARMLDPRACLDLLAIANTGSESADIYGRAFDYAARAVRRKLVPHRDR